MADICFDRHPSAKVFIRNPQTRTDHGKGKNFHFYKCDRVVRESLFYIAYEYVFLLSDFVSRRFFLPTDARANLQTILNKVMF